MVIEAAQRVRAGQLGTIRKVIVEYTQGWLAEPVEHAGNAQAMWRLDPKRAGASCTMGDIGVHAFNLTEFVSGLQVTELGAELNRVVAGRKLDDDGIALLRFAGGATGVLIASQICTGDENDLRLRVYGDAASLEWNQQDSNSLWIKHAHAPIELVRSASVGLDATAHAASRLPSGHPEGYIEAFANVYRSFAAHVRARDSDAASAELPFVPGIEAALRGMAFIETVVAASRSRAKWHAFPEVG
jgi:predicted dehydrogenase